MAFNDRITKTISAIVGGKAMTRPPMTEKHKEAVRDMAGAIGWLSELQRLLPDAIAAEREGREPPALPMPDRTQVIGAALSACLLIAKDMPHEEAVEALGKESAEALRDLLGVVQDVFDAAKKKNEK